MRQVPPSPRRPARRARLAVVAALLAAAPASSARADDAIPLTLEAAPATLPAHPVATGVPFPEGALWSLAELRLETAGGVEVPAQFQPLASWPDSSLKAVLVVARLPLSATTAASYVLRYGQGVSRAAYDLGLHLDEEAGAYTVTTGPLRFEVGKGGFTLLRRAWVDENGDGHFTTGEARIDAPGELYAVDAFTGREYRSSLAAAPTWSVVENGPLRVVLRLTGALRSSQGDDLTQYRVWLTAWAQSDLVEVDYTLVDPRDESDVMATRPQLALSLSDWGLRQPLLPAAGLGYAFGGANGAVHQGPLAAETYLYQGGRVNYVNGVLQPYDFTYSGVATGSKAAGWCDASGPGAGVAAMVRDLWQQFPKELNLRPDRLAIGLHPARATGPQPHLSYPTLDRVTKRYERPNTFYAAREGTAKTYQVLLQIHRGDRLAARTAEVNAVFQAHRLLLHAAPAWYAASGAFGNIVEAGPWSTGYDRWLTDSFLVPAVDAKRAAGGLVMQYGWSDFGDRMRPGYDHIENTVKVPCFYADTHHGGAHHFLIQYLRTLDPRWFELGEVTSRHFMDRDVSHAANRWGWHAQSFGPGETYAIKHNVVDHHSFAQHSGHTHLSGLGDLYLLTGDRREREVIDEVAGWWTQAVPVFFPVPFPEPHEAETTRDYGRPLAVLNQAYRATGNPVYHDAAAAIVRHLIAWWQTPREHTQAGQWVEDFDWLQGTGWTWMYPLSDDCPPGWNGTGHVQIDGDSMSSLIDFYEADQGPGTVDRMLLEELILQDVQYTVKWLWVEPPGQAPYFKYSEPRDMVADDNMLLHALAFARRLYDSGAGMDRSWYTKAPKWLEIVAARWQDWKTVRTRPSLVSGTYGYDLFPTQYFRLMRDLEASYPDLAVAPLTVPPLGGAGAALAITDTTRNQGGAAVAASTNRFYLSIDDRLDGADVLLGERAVPALPAAGASTATTPVTIPAGTATGAYQVLARADDGLAIEELFEANNLAAAPVRIGPDLVVSSLVVPATGGAGLSMTVTSTVKNQGGGASAASLIRFYLSSDRFLGAGDTPLSTRSVPALAPGETSSGGTPTLIPAETATGTWYVLGEADSDRVVAEADEANNLLYKTSKIGPDVIVSTLVAPNSVRTGGSLTVTDTNRNGGGGNAAPSTTRIYLSTNATWDQNDVLLGSRSVPLLAPLATSAGPTPVTIPAGTLPGAYYLLGRGDALGVVSETVETNNVKSRALSVTP